MSETNESDMTTLLDLLKRFIALAEERAKTLPYRINLIETLGGARETQNSKILAAFLQYKSSAGRFEILESLINHIRLRSRHSRYDAFSKIKVDHPLVNREYCHIDIYVREARKYALIIENKSNGADDQEAQLSRYIETAISERFEESQIYILYLPPRDGEKPEKQSWGDYEVAFSGRYVPLSWRCDILPWMKERVLPNVRMRDIPLSSALEQYIDYWEGQFGLRAINNEVKMKLEDAVIEGLALNLQQNEAGRSLERISDAISSAQALTDTLENLAIKTKCRLELNFWGHLIEELKRKGYAATGGIRLTEEDILSNYQLDRVSRWNYVGIRIRFEANGRPFDFECWAQVSGHYGFRFMDESGKDESGERPATLNARSQEIERIVDTILPGCDHWPAWYGCASDCDLDFRHMGYKTVAGKLGTSDICAAFALQWANQFDSYINKFKELLTEQQP